MTLGLALWSTLSPQERVAVIAHELAHQVNGTSATECSSTAQRRAWRDGHTYWIRARASCRCDQGSRGWRSSSRFC